MSQGFVAKGTQLQAGDGGSPTETFQTIPEVRNISGPSMQADEVDFTNMDTVGSYKDFKQGLKDWGSVQFEVNWIPSDSLHQQIFDDYVSGDIRNYKMILPDGGSTTFTFAAFVKGMPASLNPNQPATIRVDLRVVADPAPTLG